MKVYKDNEIIKAAKYRQCALGFTTVNKNFHKFYQKLSKFTSTLI